MAFGVAVEPFQVSAPVIVDTLSAVDLVDGLAVAEAVEVAPGQRDNSACEEAAVRALPLTWFAPVPKRVAVGLWLFSVIFIAIFMLFYFQLIYVSIFHFFLIMCHYLIFPPDSGLCSHLLQPVALPSEPQGPECAELEERPLPQPIRADELKAADEYSWMEMADIFRALTSAFRELSMCFLLI